MLDLMTFVSALAYLRLDRNLSTQLIIVLCNVLNSSTTEFRLWW